MVRKTKEEALETRNRLLDAAERVFLEKGFSHSSLNDIAQAADLTRGAVYWHFKNKIDLFEALVERVRLPVESLGDCGGAEHATDPLEQLRNYAVAALRETATNQRRRRVFTILFHRFEYNTEARALELRQQAAVMDCMQRIEASLCSASEKGQLPRDLDSRSAATAFQAYFTGLLNNWLFMPKSFDLDSQAEAFVDAFFDMLRHTQSLRNSD